MFEEAHALCGMISMCSATQSEVAKKIGVSQSYVANKIRLLTFSDKIQKLITEKGLSERHARTLLRLKNDEEITEAIEKIRIMDLTVAETESLVDGMLLKSMPRNILNSGVHERISFFEDIIDESVKNLRGCGVKVRTSRDFYGNKRLITLCIEE